MMSGYLKMILLAIIVWGWFTALSHRNDYLKCVMNKGIEKCEE